MTVASRWGVVDILNGGDFSLALKNKANSGSHDLCFVLCAFTHFLCVFNFMHVLSSLAGIYLPGYIFLLPFVWCLFPLLFSLFIIIRIHGLKLNLNLILS